MKKINRSAIVPYSQEQMYKLVVDILSYPHFLPWCNKAEILQAQDDRITAKLGISFKGIRQNFTTQNFNNHCDSVRMELIDGPFNYLAGQWQFVRLSNSACKVVLDLEFSFSSRWMEKIIGPVFGIIGNTMVDSFHSRAKEIYREK